MHGQVEQVGLGVMMQGRDKEKGEGRGRVGRGGRGATEMR